MSKDKFKRKTEFIGQIGGDMECFCWTYVSAKDKIKIVGEEDFDLSNTWDVDRLYPDDIFRQMHLSPHKKYRFSIEAEEIKTEEIN